VVTFKIEFWAADFARSPLRSRSDDLPLRSRSAHMLWQTSVRSCLCIWPPRKRLMTYNKINLHSRQFIAGLLIFLTSDL